MPNTQSSHYPVRLNPSLREIRRLHLRPGPPNSPIQCHLTTVSLLSSPKPFYEALSYVWGDPSNRPSILLHDSPFPVTRNLFTALHYLRDESPNGKERILWVDAVVINQEDIDERNSQVSMMDAVYASASHVLIWLGEAQEADSHPREGGSDDAFDVFHLLAEGRETEVDLERKVSAYNVRINLNNRPWFGRVWILQELALATVDPVILCGTTWISWENFMKARRILERVGYERNLTEEEETMLKTKLDTLNDLRQAVSRNKGESLRQLIVFSRSSLATDPRDKIYGLLGMMKEEDKSVGSIVVDYRKPISVVYADAMTHLFAKGQGPYFLSGVSLGGKRDGWPSWVPDFTAQVAWQREKDEEFICGTTFYPRGVGVSGPGADADNGRILDDGKTLQVGGMFVDIVTEVLVLKETLDECLQQLSQMEDLVGRAKDRIPTDNALRPYLEKYKRSEKLWQTLIANQDTRLFSNESPPPSFEDIYETIVGRRGLPAEFSSMEDYVRDYKNNLSNQLPRRTFFTTKSGLVGLGVSGMQRGDHITIWFGAPVPFVIRPIELESAERDFYNLVGAAYVAGIMDGEMVDDIYCEDLADTNMFFIV
ncbi:hypothetical protein D9758_004543 [Tetrapyrgos nigripes]|uniref:Heterokaryon incompatibility domain-containing protein n=1 Tax=Tetrapyrgos nigripes TaxID=182062 RepID=A0A8H5GZW4_9AGAR|nr:hypothetical protein D9758_004543 [Tetrapyrgos nigripes]